MPATYEEAKALHEAGRLEEAAAAYAAVPDDSPDAARALNNLGTLHEADGRFEDAIAVYRRAVTLKPDAAILWYNLGHALQRLERLPEAILAYAQSLEFDPSDGPTHYNLGNALADQARHESAIGCYRRALECGLDDPRVQSRLGTSLLDLGHAGEALAAYRHAIEADPTVAEEWFHVGLALETLRRHDEAAESYRRSVELHPDSTAAREGLARALYSAGREEAALMVYRDWLEHDPGNPIAQHMAAALSGEATPDRADDDYVRTLFDGFAANFDRTLARLDYRAPQLLSDLLKERLGAAAGPFDVLDAGCGTGLCGPLLKPHARRLVGVDLSPEMLRQAERRAVYDELHAAELTAFLSEQAGRFDAIVAADTLIYFGDLKPVLAVAASALRPGGRFLFTLERLDESDGETRLNSHGRYAHSEAYLCERLAHAGFSVESIAAETLRREGGTPVTGFVVCAGRTPGAISLLEST
ncbi:MAG: tetratricopeptide repeat protein [Planctomycetaceae bacterium]